MTKESNPTYKCKYCEKPFRRESTLTAHLCEPKRRWQQENDTGVQFGLRAYLRFFEITQGSAKTKSYADFVESTYYSAFVKYGQYCVSIRCVNVNSFTEWLLRKNKKLDFWCKDSQYDEWLLEYLRKESPQDALERALKEMTKYAEEQPELGDFSNYFLRGNSNRICYHISSGRISPWIVFNCDSGIAFLGSLDDGQVSLILPWINPDFWNRKLQDHMADTEWCKHILKEAGL